LADNELLITRVFDAPASTLFALWTQPAHLTRWMGPANFECTDASIDLRVGGAYRITIISPTQGKNPFGGIYHEIEPNKRLVFTFAWDNDGPSAGAEMLVTIVFQEREDGKTVQIFHQSHFLNAARRDTHIGGWNQVFDSQEAYLNTIAQEHAA
jgi:uncharacterized protein YndB with AHSA1/START domain